MNINTQVNSSSYNKQEVTDSNSVSSSSAPVSDKKETETKASPLGETVKISAEGLAKIKAEEEQVQQTRSGTGNVPPPVRN
jgi:CCR4-NOT transcriptional regulation complex NOT5 subunit